jgi:uncharacterized membrane protein
MKMIDLSVDVDADLRKVYNQWTQFEDIPEFMEGIEKVQQLDDKRLHWVANVAGRRVEWDVEIYEQIPDLIIAWRSISGQFNEGHVRFERLGINRTRVHVQFVYLTTDAMKNKVDGMETLSARVKGDLIRFKQFIENRPEETGAWRGEIHGSRVSPEKARRIGARSQRVRKGNRSDRF